MTDAVCLVILGIILHSAPTVIKADIDPPAMLSAIRDVSPWPDEESHERRWQTLSANLSAHASIDATLT